MKRILVLHGPNLNQLGTREPHFYGAVTLEHINQQLQKCAQEAGVELIAKQSNSESELIGYLHQAIEDQITHLIMNLAAYTHTSVALRDAVILTQLPFIEVHLSNIYTRESFRHHSYFSDIAQGIISGLGAHGYVLALNHFLTQ